MVVVDAVIPMPCRPLYRQHRLEELRLVCPQTLAVWMIGERASEIAIDSHLAVAMITLKRTFRSVHRDLVEIDSKSIPLRIPVGEKAPLQHLIGGKANSRHNVGRREGCLLHLGEIVGRIAV
jgi:hypothetical protein